MGIGTSYKVEASRQKWTNEPLREALDSNEASEVTSDVISPEQYKPRYEAPPGSASLSRYKLRSLGVICNITT